MGAAVILVVLAILTFIYLPGIRTPPNSGPDGLQLADRALVAASPQKRLPPNGKSLNICVNGQQYVWRYTYANDCDNAPLNAIFNYTEMVVPTDTTVTLDITAQDVAHSWWIPKLGGKFDAIPGYTNHTWLKVPGDAIRRGPQQRPLPRPVRRAVRAQPRQHGRRGAGGAARRVRGLGRRPAPGHQAGQPGRPAAAPRDRGRTGRRRLSTVRPFPSLPRA